MQRLVLAGLALALAGCQTERGSPAAGELEATWRVPADADIPEDSLGAAVRRGLALFTGTADSLPAFAPGNIVCSNCHLGAGRVADAAPLVGSHARFPKYMDRSGAVISLADRVNYCFTRSLAGSKLPTDSREMQDILAYIAWLSRDATPSSAGALPGATGLPVMEASLTGDAARGASIYAAKCVACHLPDGSGNPGGAPRIPALWGPRSFSVGASMARQSKAASFIWHNMPFGAGRTLTPQEAWDLAAYVTSQPRPDSPGKEGDWPSGGAPSDVPYATKSHQAYLPPPVLRREHAASALVPAPRSIRRQ